MSRIALPVVVWIGLATSAFCQTPPPIPLRPAMPNPRRIEFPAQLKQRYRLSDRTGVAGVAFVPGSDTILILQKNHAALLLNRRTGQIQGEWKGTFRGSMDGGLAVAPDGKHVAIGTVQRVHYLTLPELKERWVYQPENGPNSAFQQLAISPDGSQLVASSHGRSLQLLKTSDGSLIRTEKPVVNSVRMVRFSRDGQSVFMVGAASTDDVPPPIPHAARWNLTTGTVDLLEKWPKRTVAYALWEQPDGRLALHGSWNSGIRQLDPQTLEEQSNTTFVSGWAHAISGDGRRYAFASQQGIVRLYDSTMPQAKLGEFSTEVRSDQMALNHDGTELLVGSDAGDIQWWRLRFPRNEDEPASAVDPENLFTPTDLTQPQVSEPDIEGIVRFDGHRGRILTVTAYPDNERVLTTGADMRVLLWNRVTGKLERRFDGVAGKAFDMYFGAAISPDGKQLLLGGGQYKGTHHLGLWDPLLLEKRTPLPGVTDTTHEVAISSDGTLCAAAGHRHDVVIWTTKTGEEKTRIPLPVPNQNGLGFHALTFATDGRHLISSAGTAITAWSVETGKLVSSVETGQCLSLRARPATNEVLVDTGRSADLYTLPGLAAKRQIPYPHHFRHADFSSDGTRLMIGGDDRMDVWDLPSNERLFQRIGKLDVVTMAPDGKTIYFTEASTLAAMPLP